MTSYRTLLLGGAFVLSAVAPASADTLIAKIAATTHKSASDTMALSSVQKLQALAMLLRAEGPLAI